ncbi:MAG: cytochrome c oxidase assembly protein [bacterium]|nr:cytochrome c oxidase assembly protein [bacterium]
MKRNRKFLVGFILFAFAMFAFAYVNVPLYRLVCQKLGIAIAPDEKNISRLTDGQTGREIKVRFSGLVAQGLKVSFASGEQIQTIQLGKEAQNKYVFTNLTNDTVRFRPVHSVLPEDAASKINLTKCFCFDDQTLLPHQRLELPVIYTIGSNLDKEIDYVTMHYTLFPKPTSTK